MIHKVATLLSLALLYCVAAAPQSVIITVVNKHFTPPRPVPDVRVSLSFFDGSQKITDARERTNRDGKTKLDVSPEAQQRGDLRIEISEVAGLVVYQPSEGLVPKGMSALTVVVLPKGSPALMEPAQIEAMLNRLSRLSVRNQRPAIAVDTAQKPKAEFDDALREWATNNGLPYEEANQKVSEWAKDTLAHKEQKSLNEQAEAELALRHYDRAAQLFDELTNGKRQELRSRKEAFLTEQRDTLREEVQSALQTVTALQLDGKYHVATGKINEAREDAAEQYHAFPTDKVMRDIWLWASLIAEGTLVQEGSRDIAANKPELFQGVISDLQALLKQLDRTTDRDRWTHAQGMLAGTLVYLSELSARAPAAEYRAQALVAARAAVDGANKELDPKGWAYFEGFLGLVIAAQAARGFTDSAANPAEVRDLFRQSADAIRASLKVYTKTDDPNDWAMEQNALASTLAAESILIDPPQNVELLVQAEAANRAAIEVFTKEKSPKDWAVTESSIASILFSRGLAANGPQALQFLNDSVAGFRAALEMRNRETETIAWALTCQNVALSLRERGRRQTGEKSVADLRESATYFRHALEIYEKSSGQQWAALQVDLGETLALQGSRMAESPPSQEVLLQSAAAYSAALEVLTKNEAAYRWANAKSVLGSVLATLAERSQEPQSNVWLTPAIAAFRASLEVFNKQETPGEWSSVQANLGELFAVQADRVPADQASDPLKQSAAAYSAALEVDPKNAQWLGVLASLYHDRLFDFPKAYEISAQMQQTAPSDVNALNFAEAALTASRFTDCIEALKQIDEARLQAILVPTRRTLLFTCQWGAAQRDDFAKTVLTLATDSNMQVQKNGWNSVGDRKYLSDAPKFSANRAWWIKLFQALQDGNAAAMSEASHALAAAAGK